MDKKLESFKEAAYLDYFRAFSVGTMATIRKLESEFKQQMNDNYFFDPSTMFKRVKTLLGTYQIMILEINDSFEFMEIPEFGQCILKIFLQMMSIIRWLLKAMSLRPTMPEMEVRRNNERNTISMPKRKDKIDQKEVYRIRQKAQFLLNDMQAELLKIEQEQVEAEAPRNQILNKEKFLKISPSDIQSLIEETVFSLVRNSECLHQFVEIRENAMRENQCENGIDMYNRIRDHFEEQSAAQVKETKAKLQLLFDNFSQTHEKQKKAKMVSTEVQVKIVEKQPIEESKPKKNNEVIKSIERELKVQKEQNQLLKQMLENKTKSFESEIVKLKIKIAVQNRGRKNSVSSKSKEGSSVFLGDENPPPPSKNKLDSETFIGQSERSIKVGFRTEKRKVKLQNEKQVKFQSQVTGSDQDPNFYLESKIINLCYEPEIQAHTSRAILKMVKRNSTSNFKIASDQIRKRKKTLDQNKSISPEKPKSNQGLVSFCEVTQNVQIGVQTQPLRLSSKFQGQETVKFQIQSKLIQINVWPTIQSVQHSQTRLHSIEKSLNPITKSINKVVSRPLNNSLLSKQQSQKYFPGLKQNSFSFCLSSGLCKQKNQQNSTNSMVRQSLMEQIQRKTYKKINNMNIDSFIQSKGSQKFYQFRQKNQSFLLQQIKKLQFVEEDVTCLFFTVENAKNYELINFATEEQKLVAANCFKKPQGKSTNSANHLRLGNEKSRMNLDAEAFSIMIRLLLKQISLMKKNKQIYEELRNFIRFPYSLLKHGRTKKWVELERLESEIDSNELRRKLGRIIRIHAKCPKSKTGFGQFCEHIFVFYEKLGIYVPH